MAITIESPLSRSPRSNKSNFPFTLKRQRPTYGVLLALLSFVAVSWRVYSHGEYDFFFQWSPTNANNSYEYSLDLLNSGARPPAVSLLSNTKRNLFDENMDDTPTNNDVHNKDSLDKPLQKQPQQQTLPVFVQKHCDLRRTVHNNATNETVEELEEWWPEDATDWRRRAPAVLIIGAKKAGTTTLWLSLMKHATQHPKIQRARVKELLYFIPDRFQGWKRDENDTRNTVMVHEARRNMYEKEKKDYAVQFLQRNPDTISLEATPDYLLFSTYSARAILCTVPWVKLVVLLRHPIDRLWSHYNFLIDPNIIGLKNLLPFDEWVDKDIRRLQSYGILPQNLSHVEEHSGSVAEKQGWKVYQEKFHSRDDRPLARSLYAIQLEEWFDHLREVGKDPLDCVKIILNSDLKKYQEAVVNDVVDWMGKPTVQQQPHANLNNPHQQQRRVQGHPRMRIQRQQKPAEPLTKGMVTTYTSPAMKEETRQKLELLFAPYNRRLYRLLGPEWDGVFDA